VDNNGNRNWVLEVQIPLLVLISAFLNNFIRNSSAICDEYGIQLKNVVIITSSVSERKRK